jgi:hypothetical protein
MRSKYIYLVGAENSEDVTFVFPMAAFTVKRELATYLRGQPGLAHLVVLRYAAVSGSWRTDPAKDYVE